MVLASVISIVLYGGWVRAESCESFDTNTGERMVERINRRYDDFFRYQEHLEEREHARNKGRGENRVLLEAHDRRVEKARIEYIKNRRPKPDTTDLERKAEQQHKLRLAKMEAARRCYVKQQTQAESVLKRGRTIPDKKEYELED